MKKKIYNLEIIALFKSFNSPGKLRVTVSAILCVFRDAVFRVLAMEKPEESCPPITKI